MTTDADEEMARFDSYVALNKEEKSQSPDGMDDFDRHDWQAGIDKMPAHVQDNLVVSPFKWLDTDGKRWKWSGVAIPDQGVPILEEEHTS